MIGFLYYQYIKWKHLVVFNDEEDISWLLAALEVILLCFFGIMYLWSKQ